MSADQEEKGLVPCDVRYQIEQYKEVVNEALDRMRSLDITSKQEAEQAIDVACEAVNLKERIEEKVDEIVAPHKAFQAEVKQIAKGFVEDLDEVKSTVVSKLEGWKLGSSYVGNLGTARMSAYEQVGYEYKIIDPQLVPREYLTLDEARVKLDVKQGRRNIAGLEIVEKKKTILKRSA